MLSDGTAIAIPSAVAVCLNAPSGAGCFRTNALKNVLQVVDLVLMHLLVLSAFSPMSKQIIRVCITVLMYRLVLGAF